MFNRQHQQNRAALLTMLHGLRLSRILLPLETVIRAQSSGEFGLLVMGYASFAQHLLDQCFYCRTSFVWLVYIPRIFEFSEFRLKPLKPLYRFDSIFPSRHYSFWSVLQIKLQSLSPYSVLHLCIGGLHT